VLLGLCDQFLTLFALFRIHKNAWSKLATDPNLKFSQLADFEPRVRASKLKAMAGSAAFLRFVKSAESVKSHH
jgi:hypothetical protein